MEEQHHTPTSEETSGEGRILQRSAGANGFNLYGNGNTIILGNGNTLNDLQTITKLLDIISKQADLITDLQRRLMEAAEREMEIINRHTPK